MKSIMQPVLLRDGTKPERGEIKTADSSQMWWGSMWPEDYALFVDHFEHLFEADPTGQHIFEINSPGGLVEGCFEACFDLMALRELYPDAQVIVYSQGLLCSAAYAIASALTTGPKDLIVATPQAEVGSIGVRTAVITLVMPDDIQIEYITSDAPAKVDGAEGNPMSDEAKAKLQEEIDRLGDTFRGLVSKSRELSTETIRELRGETRMGDAALDAGLIDLVVNSYRDLLNQVMPKEETMADPISDPNPADQAAAQSKLEAHIAKLEADIAQLETANLLASRPDVPESVRTVLASKRPAEVKEFLAALPKRAAGTAPVVSVAATAAKDLPSYYPVTEDLDSVPAAHRRQINRYLPKRPLSKERAARGAYNPVTGELTIR
jgi:ClpP class serine protease